MGCCKICKKKGHNQRTCPKLDVLEPKPKKDKASTKKPARTRKTKVSAPKPAAAAKERGSAEPNPVVSDEVSAIVSRSEVAQMRDHLRQVDAFLERVLGYPSIGEALRSFAGQFADYVDRGTRVSDGRRGKVGRRGSRASAKGGDEEGD